MKKINKFFFLNGFIGSFTFYYFVRKIQSNYNVDPSTDAYGLMGAAYYGLLLGFVFGIKFIDLEKLISFFKKK
jgi:hypothetical protein